MFTCARWFAVVGLSAAVMLFIAGCGSSGPELGDVSGKVTKDGKPLAKAIVTFQPEVAEGVEASTSYGNTNEEGVYSLQYSAELTGAMIGKHRISVAVPDTDIEAVFEKDVASGSNTIDLEMNQGSKPESGGDEESGSGGEP